MQRKLKSLGVIFIFKSFVQFIFNIFEDKMYDQSITIYSVSGAGILANRVEPTAAPTVGKNSNPF